MDPSQKPPPTGYQEIFTRYRSEVLRWIRSVGVPDRDLEDVAQGVFYQLHRAQADGRFYDGDPRPWLRQVARRAGRGYLKTRGMRSMQLSSVDVGASPDETAPSAEQRLLLLEERALLHELLKSVPEERRRVFIMFTFEEMTISEIVEALGIAEGTVNSRLRAARQDLDAAYARWRARNRGALLLPFGLGALPYRDLVAALVLRARERIAWARSALGRALATAKGLGVGAGLAVALGALPAPPFYPSAAGFRDEVAPKAARAAMATSTTPTAINAPSSAMSSSAPLPASSAKSAAGAPLGASLDNEAKMERSSLARIKVILKTDPAAALAALEEHKKAFLRERFSQERDDLEALLRVKVKEQAQASSSALPP